MLVDRGVIASAIVMVSRFSASEGWTENAITTGNHERDGFVPGGNLSDGVKEISGTDLIIKAQGSVQGDMRMFLYELFQPEFFCYCRDRLINPPFCPSETDLDKKYIIHAWYPVG